MKPVCGCTERTHEEVRKAIREAELAVVKGTQKETPAAETKNPQPARRPNGVNSHLRTRADYLREHPEVNPWDFNW